MLNEAFGKTRFPAYRCDSRALGPSERTAPEKEVHGCSPELSSSFKIMTQLLFVL